MDLVFASFNKNKVKEIQALLPANITLRDLSFIPNLNDIPETGVTFAENAKMKADYIYNNYNIDCFADDSGLEIEALNGEPGVYSARYAGEDKNDINNTNLVLKKLEGIHNRKACFKTVICLVLNGEHYFFEGRIDGVINHSPKGTDGFGYDPIFIPDGYQTTFAEISLEEKNKISHRALATKKLITELIKF